MEGDPRVDDDVPHIRVGGTNHHGRKGRQRRLPSGGSTCRKVLGLLDVLEVEAAVARDVSFWALGEARVERRQAHPPERCRSAAAPRGPPRGRTRAPAGAA